MTTTHNHITVLLEEATQALEISPGKWYIDGTFGRGGHSREILKAGGKVIGFDVDAEAIKQGTETFAQDIQSNRLILVRENFEKLEKSISELRHRKEIPEIGGILFDFGTSTDQLMNDERGFSFTGDGELDMRMDDRLGVKAKDLLAVLPLKQLTQLFEEYGGEEKAYQIAAGIVKERACQPIATVEQLVKIISRHKQRQGKLHPATKVFQALRIAVNDELTAIKAVLPQALALLVGHKGRIVSIAFHEGEDRIVKHQFRLWEETNQGRVITEKPILPSNEEVTHNPRARSAKLRIFETYEHNHL